MSGALSPGMRRLSAVALLLAVVATAGLLLVMPLWQLSRDYDARIDELQRQLQRFSELAQRQPTLRRDRDRLQASGASGRYYLAGSTAALAAAELQRFAKRVVTANQGQITSTQVVPVEDGGDIQRVVLRVQMRGELTMIKKAFHALETGQPYLFLNNVRIRIWRGGLRRRSSLANLAAQQLDVQFDLTGYLLKSEQDDKAI